ncbi:Homeotic protein proboscipedia [Folsomia candida]|uniref:Homeotic protein proboscipedia n=1 Tax=Folsomia candida TaxID=158441 RepID=A0A226ED00_FOLCA|nr:Homeotic protein proboscipedia [Folsomia candida]
MIDRVAVTCSPTWPRSLLHHSSSSPASSSVLTSVESMDSLEGFDSSESGFIATRPSIADFMAAVPNLGEHHNNNNNIAGGNHVNSTSPATPNSLFCGQGGNIGGSATQPNNATGNTSSTNEYPWMKEKKTTRKNNHQGAGLKVSRAEVFKSSTQEDRKARLRKSSKKLDLGKLASEKARFAQARS